MAREQRGERLLAADQRVYVALALLVAPAGAGGQRAQVLVHLGVGLVARRLDERAVEGQPAQLARQLGERRLARGERVLEPVQDRAVAVVDPVRPVLRGLVEMARQHGLHGPPRRGRPQLADEQPVRGGLQCRRPLEAGHPVARERALQRGDEAVRQALRRRVERAQVRVQPLLRAAQARVVAVRAVQRADVGVGLEQRPLPVGVHGRAGQAARDRRDVALVEVVAEHEPLQPLEVARAVAVRRVEGDAPRVVAALVALVLDRVDLDERPPGRDVRVRRHEHLSHAAVDR